MFVDCEHFGMNGLRAQELDAVTDGTREQSLVLFLRHHLHFFSSLVFES